MKYARTVARLESAKRLIDALARAALVGVKSGSPRRTRVNNFAKAARDEIAAAQLGLTRRTRSKGADMQPTVELPLEQRTWTRRDDGSSVLVQDQYTVVVTMSDMGTFGYVVYVEPKPGDICVLDSDEGYVVRSSARGAARKALNTLVARNAQPQPGRSL